MTESTTSAYRAYLERIAELANRDIDDGLKDLFRERIAGGGPPLSRDEGDVADVLILAYKQQRKAGDQAALRRLRRVAVDLLTEALRKGTAEDRMEAAKVLHEIDLCGHLVAWFEVKDDAELAGSLSDMLFGLLGSRLSQPFSEIMRLDGQPLELAVRAFDLLLAVTSHESAAAWPNHIKETLTRLFERTLETSRQIMNLGDTQIRLLFLTFQATILGRPYWAGYHGLQRMLDCVQQQSSQLHGLISRFWGLCYDYELLLEQAPDWREKFTNGIVGALVDEGIHQGSVEQISPKLRECIEKMGLLQVVEAKIPAAPRVAEPQMRRIRQESRAGQLH